MTGTRQQGPTGPALFDLTGKTAFVTGARTGIGAAVAIGLAQAGADLILASRRDDADQTTEAVRSAGRRAETVGLDLSDPDTVRRTCADLLTRRSIDIVVNNAGIITRADAVATSARDWSDVHRINLDAAWAVCQTIGESMVERGSGKIINVASLLSFQGGIRVAPYVSSKHALAGLTRALASEWASRGVQVNAIAPGYIVTANTAPLRADPDRAASISARIPAGRWGEPHDLVGAAVFLASSASDYVNGHILAVDGGWLAR
jgi:2-dehydro-3-deoxy-D-gluconate 5-dehydrogenase